MQRDLDDCFLSGFTQGSRRVDYSQLYTPGRIIIVAQMRCKNVQMKKSCFVTVILKIIVLYGETSFLRDRRKFSAVSVRPRTVTNVINTSRVAEDRGIWELPSALVNSLDSTLTENTSCRERCENRFRSTVGRKRTKWTSLDSLRLDRRVMPRSIHLTGTRLYVNHSRSGLSSIEYHCIVTHLVSAGSILGIPILGETRGRIATGKSPIFPSFSLLLAANNLLSCIYLVDKKR